MDNILPAYDDPLFSILIIILLVLIVAIGAFVMGNLKEERKRQSLQEFLSRFSTKDCQLDVVEMPFSNSLISPLTLLANAFKNQGEYQKAINLNLYLIKNISNFYDKETILSELGQTYLKAGFLKRAESIYLEILHKHARNSEALYHLGLIYERLNEYEKALETFQPLKILGEETQELEAHIKLSQLLTDNQLKKELKIERLKSLLKDESYSYRRIIQALFGLDKEEAWSAIDRTKTHLILDILWFLPSSNLNLDIIYQDEILSSIYLAKGVISMREPTPISNIFAIDTIVSAQKGGNSSIGLNFSYGCEACKQHFPMAFTRCPKCYAINRLQVKETLAKRESQRGYSLL